MGLLLWGQAGNLKLRLESPRTPHGLPLPGSHDLARQAPGAWLRRNTSGEELLCSFVGLPAYEYEGPYLDTARLNSAPDPVRAEQAPYYLDIAESATAPLKWSRDGRKLVGTFVYDSFSDRYDLYARTDSEIFQKGLHHLIMPWSRVWSASPDQDQVDAWAVTNTILIPVGDTIGFELTAPAPPELVFRPILRRLESGDVEGADKTRFPTLALTAADPEVRVRLSVFVNGQPVHQREMNLGESIGTEVIVSADRLEASADEGRKARRKYRVTMRCEGVTGANPESLVLVLREGYARVGEPLRSEDFKLLYERCAKRVDYVATLGLPCGVTQR